MNSQLEASRYLKRCGAAVSIVPVHCIGDAGWMPGVVMIERVGARQKTEDRSHEATGGTPVVHSSQATGGTPVVHSGDELGLAHQLPDWHFWSMRKQLIVCIGIAVAVCLVVAVLGTGGMLALAVSLLLLVVAARANGMGATKQESDFQPRTNYENETAE